MSKCNTIKVFDLSNITGCLLEIQYAVPRNKMYYSAVSFDLGCDFAEGYFC